MVVVVTVDAMEHHVMVVDVEQAIAHLNVAKTDALRDDFEHFTGGVFHRHHQMIEPGFSADHCCGAVTSMVKPLSSDCPTVRRPVVP